MNEEKEGDIIKLESRKSISSMPVDVRFLKQDILYFKDDILKDIRKFEDKISTKIDNELKSNTEKFETYERRIIEISNKINFSDDLNYEMNNVLLKLKNFDNFKTKTENFFYSTNSKINAIQKETTQSINDNEKLINANLFYPGVIGNKSRFTNYHKFVDYVLGEIKKINSFIDTIRALNLPDFVKKVNFDHNNMRYELNNSIQLSKNLIQKSLQEFSSNLTNFKIDIENKLNIGNNQIQIIESKVDQIFKDCMEKIKNIEKDIVEKHKELSKELKNVKEINRMPIINNNKNSEKNDESNNNINNNNSNNDFIDIGNDKLKIFVENKENVVKKIIKNPPLSAGHRVYDKLPNEERKSMNLKEKQKKHFNYFKQYKRNTNNYSISNIAKIEFKKVIFPDPKNYNSFKLNNSTKSFILTPSGKIENKINISIKKKRAITSKQNSFNKLRLNKNFEFYKVSNDNRNNTFYNNDKNISLLEKGMNLSQKCIKLN